MSEQYECAREDGLGTLGIIYVCRQCCQLDISFHSNVFFSFVITTHLWVVFARRLIISKNNIDFQSHC